MPVSRINHRKRALFEQKMADRSATAMVRAIHQRLAALHAAEAGRADCLLPDGGAER